MRNKFIEVDQQVEVYVSDGSKTAGDIFQKDFYNKLSFHWYVVSMASIGNELVVVYQRDCR